MRSKVLSQTENGVITFTLVFESGDEVVSLLTRFAGEKKYRERSLHCQTNSGDGSGPVCGETGAKT